MKISSDLECKKESAIFPINIFARIGRNSKKSLNFKIKTIKGIPAFYAM
jgi:hypothetical protein